MARRRLAMTREGQPAGAKVGHHYRTVRRAHPIKGGNRVRVVLETRPGRPGEIVEMPWEEYSASQSGLGESTRQRGAVEAIRGFLFGD
jgi:hypothetical protein